jgi:hypothetical protein
MDALALHGRLATAIGLYFAAIGVWGIALGARGSGPSPSFRGAIVVAEIAVVVQGLLGAFTALQRPPEWIHVLYGLALVVAMPLAATVVRDYTPRRMSISLGLAALFAAGLVVRGITTA